MRQKRIFLLLLILSCTINLFAQNHYSRFESIDVQHYKFEIHLNDTTNQIEGKASILIRFLQPQSSFSLDLVGKTEETGMTVKSVASRLESGFTLADDKLNINLNEETVAGDTCTFIINYFGIPADGLVISENQYGKRTFFGDNWPDRAKNWLPCVDHPSDKATLEFLVYAPEHYEIVSNGMSVEKKQLPNKMEFTLWKEDVPISTKLMVIGAADFAVGNELIFNDIPVSSWVFAENKEQGFKNYKYGTEALKYFSELVGPYSYEKLAHVQSKTRYGGMENASCIFYHENTAISDRSQEALFAHEVAHQWFGNSATEQNWHHVWLSEGFATYLTHVYMQHFYGDQLFKERLKEDRERVIAYSERNLAPIIDTTVTEYIRLLNPNSYQKASWFLHMLRNKLGNDTFFEGLQKYYHDYQNSTALTKDFQQVMETVSGMDLEKFFEQWLWQAGQPVLSYSWGETTRDGAIEEQHLSIVQQNNTMFTFPLEVEIQYEDGTTELNTFKIEGLEKEQQFQVKNTSKIKAIILDPNVKLLFELQLKKL